MSKLFFIDEVGILNLANEELAEHGFAGTLEVEINARSIELE